LLGEYPTRDGLREQLAPVIREVLATALARVAAGEPGEPQPRVGACRAPLLEPEFSTVDWSRPAREIHNQVRMFGYLGSDRAPVARVGREWRRLVRTSLRPGGGLRVECGDGPIWVVESVPAKPPVTG
jgi:methionyl-tRNA formyltransferase